MSGGFTLVDFTVPTRDVPMTHPPAEAPLCSDCRRLDLCFFDPFCGGCQDILLDSKTSISELFAVMRQWVPQTQRNMAALSRQVLRRGANVNDRDGLTDLTLLHYACKSGAAGVGNQQAAVNLVNSLLTKGADVEMRCRWTDMNALHYAIFFDSAAIVEKLAEHCPKLVMTTCSEFERATTLHIAAANLTLASAKILLVHGADGSLKDNLDRLPYECVPETPGKDFEEDARELLDLLKNAAENPPPKPRSKRMAALYGGSPTRSPTHSKTAPSSEHHHGNNVNKQTGSNSNSSSSSSSNQTDNTVTPSTPSKSRSRSPIPPRLTVSVPTSKSPAPSHTSTISTTSTRTPHTSTGSMSGSSRTQSPITEEVTMATLGLRVGDRIVIDSASAKPKCGVVRYGGTTEFAPGQWIGVELEEEIGKNDGSYGGIRYFSCRPKHGLFVPIHRVSKAQPSASKPPHPSHPSHPSHSPKPPSTPERRRKKKQARQLTLAKQDSLVATNKAIEAQAHLNMNTDIQVGERVVVSGRRAGVLRFAGAVKFAPGFWMGVELDTAHGKNSGSRSGVRYFTCKPNHGVFVLPSRVKRLTPATLAALQAATPSSTGAVSGAESVDFPTSSSSSAGQSGQSGLSSGSGSSDACPSSPSPHGSPPASRRRTNTLGRSATRSRTSKSSSSAAGGSGTGSTPLSSPSPLSLASSPDPRLELGHSVFAGGEMGIVRFIGSTEFAEGVWLGVELRKPNGRNDGSVQGVHYFSCKTGYGVFVRPEKATHRGITCSKLVEQKQAAAAATSSTKKS